MLLSSIVPFIAYAFVTVSFARPAPKVDVLNSLALWDVEALEKRQDSYSLTGRAVDVADSISSSDDAYKEGAFTQTLGSELATAYPTKNVLIFHDQDSYVALSDDKVHIHFELPISWGRTYGYEIYVFSTGSFKRAGDGGYANWAIYGSFSNPDENGLITFYQREQ